MNEKVKYWVDLSDYDLETAGAMLKTKRLLYVGFMCHQSIEKIFKAYFVTLHDQTPPFSHSLSYLAQKGEFYDELDDDHKEFLDQLEPLNIEARYPSHKERLMQSLSLEKCNELITNSKALQSWIKKKL